MCIFITISRKFRLESRFESKYKIDEEKIQESAQIMKTYRLKMYLRKDKANKLMILYINYLISSQQYLREYTVINTCKKRLSRQVD